eukprot:6049461-Prorocentrum_lima.AAC.1
MAVCRLRGKGARNIALQWDRTLAPTGLPMFVEDDFSLLTTQVYRYLGQVLHICGLDGPNIRFRTGVAMMALAAMRSCSR